jgi:hypothetical protein
MTSDPKTYNRAPKPRTAAENRQASVMANCITIYETHDEVCAKREQSWRLLQGAEPSKWLSFGSLAVNLRYAPYA